MEGLTVLRSLAQNHGDTLRPRLRDVCLALVQEVAPPLWACSLVLSLSLPCNMETSVCHCGWACEWAGGWVWTVRHCLQV